MSRSRLPLASLFGPVLALFIPACSAPPLVSAGARESELTEVRIPAPSPPREPAPTTGDRGLWREADASVMLAGQRLDGEPFPSGQAEADAGEGEGVWASLRRGFALVREDYG